MITSDAKGSGRIEACIILSWPQWCYCRQQPSDGENGDHVTNADMAFGLPLPPLWTMLPQSPAVFIDDAKNRRPL